MKSIITDRLNLLPWVLALIAVRCFMLTHAGWQAGDAGQAAFYLMLGITALALTAARIIVRRRIRREGRDPSVVGTRDRAQ